MCDALLLQLCVGCSCAGSIVFVGSVLSVLILEFSLHS